MEAYRKKVKNGLRIGIFLILAAAGLGIFNFLVMAGSIPVYTENTMLLSFQTGLLIGLAMVAIANMGNLRRGLKSEAELQKMFNKENDERLILIRQKAGSPMLVYTSCSMIIAAVITGYFSITVFWTLIVAGVAQLLCSLLMQIYYMKTM